jgi:hypothetical protein
MYSTIKPNNAWAIPECDETALLSVYGLRAIEVGSYLWSADYGYFEITAYDTETCVITVKNNCNEGNAEPGTIVAACSDFIVTAPPGSSSDLCSLGEVDEGNVVVCGGDPATSSILTSAAKGYVLTATDNGNPPEAAYRPLGEADCTTLTSGLSVLSGTAIYTNVPVADSSIFTVGDIIRFGNSTLRAVVDAAPDGTHIDITFGPVPGSNTSFLTGTLVCPIDCCEAAEIDILGKVLAFENLLITSMTPDTLSGVSFNSTLTLPTMNVYNPHPTKALKVIIDIAFSAAGNVVTGVTDKFKWTVRSEYVADGGTFADEVTSSIICPYVPSDASYQLQHGAAGADDQVEIPPLTSYTIDITGYVLKQVTGGAGALNTLLGTLAAKVTALEFV